MFDRIKRWVDIGGNKGLDCKNKNNKKTNRQRKKQRKDTLGEILGGSKYVTPCFMSLYLK
ncbi:hypothetical protein JW935_01650 [candidate division KSB1 bacterium]|nr:hypothetical protein [candidate division KSB1 bacterium]